MAAIVSGTVLSSLFYDEISSQGDQEGYLLGKVVNHVKDNISDSQISTSKVETVTYIYSFLPWPSENRFYNSAGRVNPTKAITLLKGKHQDLIGWFKFRRNSTLRPSLKEQNLHRHLLESLPVEDDTKFLFFLCSSSFSYNQSTHTFDHVLFRRQHGKLQKVSMSMVNLGDTTHMEYKTHGNLTINKQGSSLQPVIDQFHDSFVSGSGNMYEIGKIRGISSTLHEALQGLSEKVQTSEVELSALEEEVKLMTYRLMEQEERKRAAVRALEKKAPSPPPTVVTSPVMSPPFGGSHKLNVSRSEFRLRLGESGRRQRQMSVDDNDGVATEGTGVSLIDLEDSLQSTQDENEILQPVVEGMDDRTAETTTIQTHKTRHDNPERKSTRTRDAASTVVHSAEDDKPADVFSFVSNLLEKEIKAPDNLPGKSASVNHEVGKPTVKREVPGNTNNSVPSNMRRPHSRAEARAMKMGQSETSEMTSRTRQPVRGSMQSGAIAAEVKGERSRPQRTRAKPGQAVRSRSRESPPANQRLNASVLGSSRTKSASPSGCRTPLKKTACENGTDRAGMIDDATLSSSPVF